MHKYLNIAARLIAIGGIGFLSLFALDVFEAGAAPMQVALGLFMHLLPSFGLLIILAIAWRWPPVGGIMFLVVACLPLAFLSNPLWVNALLASPFAVAGVLFIAGALRRS